MSVRACMSVAAAAVLGAGASGCNLYFEESVDAPFGLSDARRPTDARFPIIDAADDYNARPLALPCMHEVTGVRVWPQGGDFLQVIRACEAGPIVSQVSVSGGLFEFGARADWVHQYRHARAFDADRRDSLDVLATSDNGLDAGLFWGQSGNWRSLDFARPFADLVIGDLAPIGPHPTLVVAGDNALRLVMQTESYAPSFPFDIAGDADREIATGRDFVRVAVADMGDLLARDIFYVARTGSGLELGAAMQTAATPPTFTVTPLATRPLATQALPLLVGDVDGDGRDDVIGTAREIFVYSSRRGALTFLGDTAADMAIGDVDGDGTRDVLYISGDGTQVRRLLVSDDGARTVLASSAWAAPGGDRIVLARLDGDLRDDVVLLRRRGLPDSTLVPLVTPISAP